MKANFLARGSLGAIAIFAMAGSHASATEKVIYSFSSFSYLYGSLVEDDSGNLYGPDYDLDGNGAIYRLKKGNDKWKFQVVHDFNITDGSSPSSGLIRDHSLKNTFYGVTGYGGSHNGGTVFSLVHSGTGWVETVLYSFTSGSDGFVPSASLWQDAATGNLYGTNLGGTGNCGTAFELSQSNGHWTLRTLYTFQGGNDGCVPITQLQPGPSAGTLVGSTYRGGTADAGIVFELTESGDSWTESVIHSFAGGIDGADPYDLAATKSGTIYGVGNTAGMYGGGTVFQLKPRRDGTWRYKVIYAFQGNDGYNPVGILWDRSGLYGTTQNGGSSNFGTVFKLVANGRSWTESILHSFLGGGDGTSPQVRPMLEPQTGVLFGTTENGGTYGLGAVYMLSP